VRACACTRMFVCACVRLVRYVLDMLPGRSVRARARVVFTCTCAFVHMVLSTYRTSHLIACTPGCQFCCRTRPLIRIIELNARWTRVVCGRTSLPPAARRPPPAARRPPPTPHRSPRGSRPSSRPRTGRGPPAAHSQVPGRPRGSLGYDECVRERHVLKRAAGISRKCAGVQCQDSRG
jgi:hypothetical protein